jgi:hypothetical protein
MRKDFTCRADGRITHIQYFAAVTIHHHATPVQNTARLFNTVFAYGRQPEWPF